MKDFSKTHTRFPRAPVTTSEFQTASSGWLATYEIFSILENHCDSIYQIKIYLQACIVELCLRQCLRFSPVGSWKCKFPLTIAPGLGHFSVLNIVYHCRSDSNVCIDAQIPTEFNARVARSWKPEKKRILDYTYSLTWSPDSRYLAFADFENGAGADNDDSICIAVFYVASNWVNNQSLTLIQHTLNFASCWMNQISIMNSQFHPVDPHFLFTMGTNIFIWRFQGM